MMTYAERNRKIKSLLKGSFSPNKVRVWAGSGTASHWVHVKIDYKIKDYSEAEELRGHIMHLISTSGVKLSTYTADDGYGTERECILIDFL